MSAPMNVPLLSASPRSATARLTCKPLLALVISSFVLVISVKDGSWGVFQWSNNIRSRVPRRSSVQLPNNRPFMDLDAMNSPQPFTSWEGTNHRYPPLHTTSPRSSEPHASAWLASDIRKVLLLLAVPFGIALAAIYQKLGLGVIDVPVQFAICATSGDEEPNGPKTKVDINGKVPELKAAEALNNLFTFVACRTIMLEIEGYDNEGGSALQHPIWLGLQDALASRRMDEHFIDELLKDPRADMRMAALRILEVRKSYASKSFNWALMQAEALRLLDAGGQQAVRRHVERTMASPPVEDAPPSGNANQ